MKQGYVVVVAGAGNAAFCAALAALGIDCARLPLVVLTHLHYDPLVMERFPAVSGELEGVAARIA